MISRIPSTDATWARVMICTLVEVLLVVMLHPIMQRRISAAGAHDFQMPRATCKYPPPLPGPPFYNSSIGSCEIPTLLAQRLECSRWWSQYQTYNLHRLGLFSNCLISLSLCSKSWISYVTYRYSQNLAPTRKENRKRKRNSPKITRDSSEICFISYLLQRSFKASFLIIAIDWAAKVTELLEEGSSYL
jgi:hypothetical protein